MQQLVSARQLLQPAREEHVCGWKLEHFRGRFVEVTGDAATATLTACTQLVLEAQRSKVLTAWIGAEGTSFFPPDLTASGIDVSALPVVRVPDVKRACWTADILLRSGSFGLVVMDLDTVQSLSFSMQTRFIGLTHQYTSTLVALTRRRHDASSLNSLVSFRGISAKRRLGHNFFEWEVCAEKDKQASTQWRHLENSRGPDGLC